MERPFIKVIAGKEMRFEVDGSVTDLSRASAPEKPAQKKVVEQVVEKAQEAVAAIEEVVKPKRRGRKPKASAD